MALIERQGFRQSNGKPSGQSVTPTFNYGYYGNPRPATNPEQSIVRDGYVIYNPQNWNWGYDNMRGTYPQNNGAYSPFSVADTLNQRAQGYQAQGLEGLANSYKTLNQENNVYNTTANKITDYYTQLANDINSRENALAERKEGLANQLSQEIANQRQYVMDYFGPNGIFTNELNKYYDENGNYLASEAGRQMAMANAEGIQSGASLGAQRAARNEAYNNAFQNYIQVKGQELNAKMQIQQQLLSYMDALRKEYGDTQNTFVIGQYERANNLLNAISQSMADSQSQIALAQLQRATAGGGGGSESQYKIIADAAEAYANGEATPEQKAIVSAFGVPMKEIVVGRKKIPYYTNNPDTGADEWNEQVYPTENLKVGEIPNPVWGPVYKTVPDWENWKGLNQNGTDMNSVLAQLAYELAKNPQIQQNGQDNSNDGE